jgi:ABC-type polysaccharide/polyol phosphate export permease
MTRSLANRAYRDLLDALTNSRVWIMLAWQEVRQRYRRSILGPFWLTISTGAMMLAMGPLYRHLLGQEIDNYFLYLSVGFVVWLFLSGLTNESCYAFTLAEGYIRNVKLPLTVYVMRVVCRNVIIFAHNLIIVVLVFLYFLPPITWHLLEVPLGIFLICVNSVSLGWILGLLSARFRDIPQIVASLVQVAFFLTPILWQASMLDRYEWAARINPYFHFIEIVRQPILGGSASAESWAAVSAITVIGFIVAFTLFARYRARIAYWV